MEEIKIYIPILKKSWKILWKFKSLWFLGFFAALISSGGEFELLTKIFFDPTSDKGFIREITSSVQSGIRDALPVGDNLWSNFTNLLTANPINIITALLVVLAAIIITVFIIWLTTVSQIGLIKNLELANKNKTTTINDGIDAGVENFWPIFTVNLVYKIILLVIFILLGQEIVWFVAVGGNMSVFIHIISLILFSVITVLISFIIRYQILYIVIKKEKIIPALKSSGRLFINNWLVSLEMAFILFLVYLIVLYLATFIIALLIAVPIVFASFSSQIPFLILTALALTSILAIIALILFATACLSVFQWSAWIVLFEQMNTGQAFSKIIRLSEQSPNISTIFRKK